MVEFQEFTDSEISTLQRYIETHVVHSVLNRVYILTENPIDKSVNFCTIYRILKSCYEYSGTELRIKLKELLEEASEVYNELYPLTINEQNSQSNYEKEMYKNNIIPILSNPEKRRIINKIINAILVFGEKIQVNRMEDFMGVDMENDFGKEVMKDLRKTIESENLN